MVMQRWVTTTSWPLPMFMGHIALRSWISLINHQTRSSPKASTITFVFLLPPAITTCPWALALQPQPSSRTVCSSATTLSTSLAHPPLSLVVSPTPFKIGSQLVWIQEQQSPTCQALQTSFKWPRPFYKCKTNVLQQISYKPPLNPRHCCCHR